MVDGRYALSPHLRQVMNGAPLLTKTLKPIKTTQLAKIHSLETIDSAIPVHGDKTLVDVIRCNDYAIRSVPFALSSLNYVWA